jgi:hypothetical protein
MFKKNIHGNNLGKVLLLNIKKSNKKNREKGHSKSEKH